MIATVIRKEWLQIRRDRLSVVLLTIVILLLALSLFMSWNYFSWYSKLQQDISENARHHWETQGEKNSHSAAHFGIYLFKPLSPFTLWDNGIDKHYGVSLYVEAHVRNQLQYKAIEDNPLLARWGELTPAWVLLVLLPLLLMWLAGNSMANDRATGIMKLISIQGISKQHYLWAKAAAFWLIGTSIVVIMWLAGGLLATALSHQSFFTAETLLLLLLYILYNGVFIHIGLAIGSLINNRRRSLVALLAIWLIVVWLVPKLSAQVSEQVYPSPLTEVFQEKISEDVAINGINGHGPKNEKILKLEKEWTAKYKVDSVQQLPLNWLGVTLQADEDINNHIFDRHYDSLYSIYEDQLRLQQTFSVASPFITARLMSMTLSATDLNSSLHFYASTENYRKQFIKILNDRLRDNSRYGGRDTGRADFWKTLPRFQYERAGLSSRWVNGRQHLVILSIWLLLSVGLMWLAAKRILLDQ